MPTVCLNVRKHPLNFAHTHTHAASDRFRIVDTNKDGLFENYSIRHMRHVCVFVSCSSYMAIRKHISYAMCTSHFKSGVRHFLDVYSKTKVPLFPHRVLRDRCIRCISVHDSLRKQLIHIIHMHRYGLVGFGEGGSI